MGPGSVAFGYDTVASHVGSFAAGQGSTASADGATALGRGTSATAAGSTAMGSSTSATALGSTAMGLSTIASGNYSTATGGGTTASGVQSVAMGSLTLASGTNALAGGDNSVAAGASALAFGQVVRAEGNGSVALGTNATAAMNGSFVFADRSAFVELRAPLPNQFFVRAGGGVKFFSNPAATLGVELAPNGAQWLALSDVRTKHHFRDLDGDDVLRKFAAMPVTEWSYKAQDAAIRHIGPTAQDFHAAFGLGEDPLRIGTLLRPARPSPAGARPPRPARPALRCRGATSRPPPPPPTGAADGAFSLAFGRWSLALGTASVALGTRASAGRGSFVFADNTGTASTLTGGTNQFVVRAAGGALFYSNSAMTLGVQLAANGTQWSSLSDVRAKHAFRDLDHDDLLARIAAMPVTEWSYKAQDAAIRHMGPTAQDFHAAFGLGEDPLRIGTLDADGVALAGVKAVEARTRHLRAELERAHAQVAALIDDNAAIRDRLSRLEQLLGKQ